MCTSGWRLEMCGDDDAEKARRPTNEEIGEERGVH